MPPTPELDKLLPLDIWANVALSMSPIEERAVTCRVAASAGVLDSYVCSVRGGQIRYCKMHDGLDYCVEQSFALQCNSSMVGSSLNGLKLNMEPDINACQWRVSWPAFFFRGMVYPPRTAVLINGHYWFYTDDDRRVTMVHETHIHYTPHSWVQHFGVTLANLPRPQLPVEEKELPDLPLRKKRDWRL